MENKIQGQIQNVEFKTQVEGQIVPKPTDTEVIHQNYNYARVDFNNPGSLLSYGDEAKDAISQILETTAQLTSDREELQVDENLLKSITTFDEVLVESEKARDKKELAIVQNFKSVLIKIGIKDLEEEKRKKSYKAQLDDYCAKIERISEAIKSQGQASYNDIELRNSIITETTPYIELLENMINVGMEDKVAYELEIEKLKLLEQTDDIKREIQYKSELATFFASKLNELQKVLTLYKEQIHSYKLQQLTDMEIVKSSATYAKDVAPILKAQGSVMVFNQQQERRLESMKAVNEAANIAVANNAKKLQQNAEAAGELSLNSGISVSTLKQAASYIQQGARIYDDCATKKRSMIESETLALKELNDSLERCQQEVLQLIDSQELVIELGNQSANQKTKIIGTKHGN